MRKPLFLVSDQQEEKQLKTNRRKYQNLPYLIPTPATPTRKGTRTASESNSIELTPPPPCSPATPTRRGAASASEPSVKRGRGRPRIASNVNSVEREPVKKKGRGRPGLTVSTSSASENTDPVVKRGIGRPRK